MKRDGQNLWQNNTPAAFWQCQPDFPQELWQEAFVRSLPLLGLPEQGMDLEAALQATLGEGQFGPERYELGFTRRMYYHLKPFLPRALTRLLRQLYGSGGEGKFRLGWPVEPRYAEFQWGVLREAMQLAGLSQVTLRHFWPERKRFAFAITHDIETAEGQRLVPVLADIEEALGFRSLFNFVIERYRLDQGLMDDLRRRGFEVGIHGLKHDGKLFNSHELFSQRAEKINRAFAEWGAVGFRSPLTLRNPYWMQELDMEYDLSFFDTDPYEPMPGGTMSIWPFQVGRFIEMPYTLPQDYTLFNVMGEKSPRIWLNKIDFIRQYHGLALVNVHPDYTAHGSAKQIYKLFLQEVRTCGEYWHAIPRDIAAWWRLRSNPGAEVPLARALLSADGLRVDYFSTAEKIKDGNPLVPSPV